MQIIDGIPVWGDADPGALAQIRACARFARRVALMADSHTGYGVPIGGVMAMAESVSPTGVGYDIGCGNKAVLTDKPAAAARDRIESIMEDIWRTISFGIGRKNARPVDHDLFDDDAWQVPAVGNLRDKAAQQLGTVGSGNYYVDVLADEARQGVGRRPLRQPWARTRRRHALLDCRWRSGRHARRAAGAGGPIGSRCRVPRSHRACRASARRPRRRPLGTPVDRPSGWCPA
jgi:RNA-splicing ligase RtcB